MSKRKLLQFAYAGLLFLLVPYIVFHLLSRARKQPAYLRHVAERFGRYRTPVSGKIIWLHAVSVGETRAAAPLIKALRVRYPRHQILLTHATPTGRETGRALFGDSVVQCYLPYDFPFSVKRFFRHFKPEIGLLMETEIWFNLIDQASQLNIPLFLVNARLSERSFRRYARFAVLTRHSLNHLTAIAAQTEADAQRLERLGATSVGVMGNLKYDVDKPETSPLLAEALRQGAGSRPVFLAASTRDGEELLLLDALKANAIPGLLMILVPRHPQRFDDIARLLAKRGVAFARRSDNAIIDAHTEILLGDTMGEMFNYYAACDVAFIGGSLLPYGSQNLIEACAAGKPVLLGPSTYNFSEAAALAIANGAAEQVQNAEQLVAALAALLKDPVRRTQMSRSGEDFYRANRGATQKVMKLISPYLTGGLSGTD